MLYFYNEEYIKVAPASPIGVRVFSTFRPDSGKVPLKYAKRKSIAETAFTKGPAGLRSGNEKCDKAGFFRFLNSELVFSSPVPPEAMSYLYWCCLFSSPLSALHANIYSACGAHVESFFHGNCGRSQYAISTDHRQALIQSPKQLPRKQPLCCVCAKIHRW